MNLAKLAELQELENVPTEMALEYLSLSIVLGISLMILAVWSSKKIGEKLGSNYGAPKNTSKTTDIQLASISELILGSSNVLFICFGMTGIMILVNNNLARAFAIGAAIAVIRFRIKLDSHGLGSTMFFGVLVGMACGVGQLQTAILLTLAYGALHAIIILLMTLDKKNENTVKGVSGISKVDTNP